MSSHNTARPVTLTGNLLIDGLLLGTQWNENVITFAFPTSGAPYGSSYPSNWPNQNFQPFSEAWAAHAVVLMNEVSTFTNLTFVQGTQETATLRWGRFNDPANLAYAYAPATQASGGDIWFANNDNPNPFLGDTMSHIFRHELGHALGLSHPFDGRGGPIPSNRDSVEYSVMSYRQHTSQVDGDFSGFYNHYEQSFMMLDIAALQYLYGANFSYNSTDTTYTFNPATGQMSVNGVAGVAPAEDIIFRTVWDGGGIDTYDFSNFAADQVIDLRPGEWSTFAPSMLAIRLQRRESPDGPLAPIYVAGNVANALVYEGDLRSLIENATGGTGDDRITGNQVDNRLVGNNGDDELLGLEGNDWLVGGAGDDSLDGGSGWDVADYSSAGAAVSVDLAIASAQNTLAAGLDRLTSIEELIGSAFNDVLTGNAAANTLRGGAGNDTLRGGGGADTLDGGSGYDVALFSGLRLSETPATFVAVEEARFVDGTLTFDASSASAQVMRLYSATLNRAPDQGGLEFNTGALASLGLQGLAGTFVGSAEFQSRFGALNNQQFVEQLFLFALGRAGDPGGIAFWTSQLDGGASRGQVVVGFSESAENVARTAATLNAGLWVPDQQALVIARLYDATFKRLPDIEGLAGWVNALKGGTSATDIAAAFAGSAEFQATFGTLSNQAFVEQLFRFCLNREGDPGGIAFWVGQLNAGSSRASVLLGFSESAEHVALTANLWLGGIRYAGFVGAPAADAAKDMDGPQILPDVEVIEVEYDPSDLGLSILDKAEDAFVLPALEDVPLPTVDPADPFNGLDFTGLRATAVNDSRMMPILPEIPDATLDFDLDASTPAQRDGHWLM